MVGMLLTLVVRPDWGLLNWGPAIGLGLAVFLLVTAYLRGAYLSVQRRTTPVDKLNNCYTGVTETSDTTT